MSRQTTSYVCCAEPLWRHRDIASWTFLASLPTRIAHAFAPSRGDAPRASCDNAAHAARIRHSCGSTADASLAFSRTSDERFLQGTHCTLIIANVESELFCVWSGLLVFLDSPLFLYRCAYLTPARGHDIWTAGADNISTRQRFMASRHRRKQ